VVEVGRTTGFDRLVVDMVLNEADDGIALFARLQRLGLAKKRLVVSGNGPTDRLSDAMNAGLRYLAKPYRAEELVQSIQEALDAPAPDTIALTSQIPGSNRPSEPSNPTSRP
jgi:DNA-binding NtrC family response regulator